MITLYGFGRIFPEAHGETKDLRVQWALEETGLPYRVHALDHTAASTTWGADLFFDSVSASHELEIQGVFRRSRAAPTKPKPGVITPKGI